MKKRDTLTITVGTFIDRVAWLQWRGAYQEANALRELGAWFTPPYRVDEHAVEERVARYIEDAKHLDNPTNWS